MKSTPKFHALALSVVAALGVASFAPNAAHAAPNKAAPAKATKAKAAKADNVNIAYEQFTLPNGLRVVVHTDRKAPIVAVNVWYHVGSKDEPAGRSGFAHLFEHLMFNGTENFPGEYFEPFQKIGATGQNGTTNTDRTNYFENVPTTALETALWMESDRMGHLLGAIDQKTLDEQRGVVQNEKRQGENAPYGQVFTKMFASLFPKRHPYNHTTIGSMNDLNAASLEDVKQWFRTWYGPNNAVLVLAGDIDAKTAKPLVEKYFGDIKASPTMAQPNVNVPKRAESREEMEDRVPAVRITRAWPVAEATNRDSDRLDLLSSILGGSKSSRLDKRLLHDEKLVDSVGTAMWGSQLASMFMVNAVVKDGVDPKKVEAIIDEEVKRLINEGPTDEELTRAKGQANANFVRGIERIGGFGGKADVLAACAIYEKNPGCFKDSLAAFNSATKKDVQDAGRKWILGNGSHTIVVNKGQRTPLVEAPAEKPAAFTLPPVDAKFKTIPTTVDRSKGVPYPTDFPSLKLPKIERATLSNGATVVLARRPEIPVIQMNWMFNGGTATDPKSQLGLANLALGLLDEGAGNYDALTFAAEAEGLGAEMGASAGIDGAEAYMSTLSSKLDPSLALFADMLQRPRYDQSEIDRVKATWVAGIKQEKANPSSASSRVLPLVLYGKDHPYGIPASGTGYESTVGNINRADLLKYTATYIRPENSTIVVVGDTTLSQIVPALNKHFGSWKGTGTAPTNAAPAVVARPSATKVYLIDQPGAVQANIFGGQLQDAPSDVAKDVMLEMANDLIGGSFTSRLNMNLREDKHWSYGARTGIRTMLGQRPWIVSAPVQIDKAAESLAEANKEIVAYVSGSRPITDMEVNDAEKRALLSLPGSFETASSVAGMLAGNVRYNRPDDYVTRRASIIEGMTPAQVAAAAKAFDPSKMVWVVVGDLSKIEKPIRDLNLGPIEILDADGNPSGSK